MTDSLVRIALNDSIMKSADRLAGKVLGKDMARALRRDPSDAEQKLWEKVRGRRSYNLKFRRQYPIGPYVADFCCIEAQLVIELDGGQHAEAVARDRERTHFIEGAGFRVIRFWNEEVLREMEYVLERIGQAIGRVSS